MLQSLSLLLQDRAGCAPAVKTTPFGSHERKSPVLSEIALTYRCQNRCFFCYANSPDRGFVVSAQPNGRQVLEMTTNEVKLVLDKIVNQPQIGSHILRFRPYLKRHFYVIISGKP